MEKITIKTLDGISIVGLWNKPAGARTAVLLLHMMPATKESWDPLVKALSKAGVASLAIDLRGHGESTSQETPPSGPDHRELDYQTFTDTQHQASRLDVDAALNFLKTRGFTESAIRVAGASIGANLTVDCLDRYAGIPRGVLLSPGMDYRGMKCEQAVRGLDGGQKIWIVAGKGDEYSAHSSEKMAALKPDAVKLSLFDGGEHGTNLFKPYPNLIKEITEYLQ